MIWLSLFSGPDVMERHECIINALKLTLTICGSLSLMSNRLGTFYTCSKVSQQRTDSSHCLSLIFFTVHVSQQQQHTFLRSCQMQRGIQIKWYAVAYVNHTIPEAWEKWQGKLDSPEDKIKVKSREKSLKWIPHFRTQHIFTENEILVKTFLNHVWMFPINQKDFAWFTWFNFWASPLLC